MPLWKNTDITASRPTWVDLSVYPVGTRIIFVDQEEAQTPAAKSKGIKGTGWYLYNEYTDSVGNTRYKAELLVAMSVHPDVSGDAPDEADDDVVPTLTSLVIDTQPDNVTVAADAPAAFTIAYTTDPVGATIAELWMVSDDEGATWSAVSGDNYDVSVAGTLTIVAADADMNGFMYQAVLNSDAMLTPVESDVATLTVTV